MAGRTVVGEFGSAELTDALPFLGKFRSRFTYCPNAASDDPHAPALLLCSWNFATQRQVDKYVRWYFERGFGCVLVMRPTAYHTYAFDPQKHLAPALLRFVEWAKVIQRRRRMVMHFFSGSCYLYIRMLKVLRDEGLATNAATLGEHLRVGLRQIGHPAIATVRGRGLLNAVVITPSANGKTAGDLCMALKDAGLLAKPTHDHIIRLAPPLVVTADQIDEAIAIFAREVERVFG